jgi:hypothetical protein
MVEVARRAGLTCSRSLGSGRTKEVITVTVRMLLTGAVVLSVAMLVPAGLAAERPDDRAGPLGVGGVAQTQVVQFEAYGTADTVEARIAAGFDAFGSEIVAVRPDDRAGPLGVGGVAQTVAVRFEPYGTADTVEARIAAGFDAFGTEIVAVRPDDRADRFTPGMGEPAPVRPDDRAERFTPGSAAEPIAATPTATTGTEWSDPLVVGALAAVVAGVAAAVAFAFIHRRGGGTGTTGTPGRPAATH